MAMKVINLAIAALKHFCLIAFISVLRISLTLRPIKIALNYLAQFYIVNIPT